uniref:Cinnamoyl-CoA reductase n=1 Tax=Solanum tuberosum TaxID=4113 RepID=M1BJU1_SOLTU
MSTEKPPVCVTGANGFIGSWVVQTLLNRGYTTIHAAIFPGTDPSHLHSLAGASNPGVRILVHEVNILDADAVSRAIAGCGGGGVFHVASPCTLEDPVDPQKELVEPAVQGTINVLTAAKRFNVRRVVLTSSISAMVPNPGWPENKVFDESSWTDLDYCKSRQDEHRDLLTNVNADNRIHSIREWRKTNGNQDQLPSPTVSGSTKSVIVPLGAPLESLHHQTIAASTQPTTPGAKWAAAPGNGGFTSRPGQQLFSSSRPVHYQQAGPGSSSALRSAEFAERPHHDPLIGRRVMTRWPHDNNFYKAIITDYSAVDARHALVYDMNTPNETWE